MHFGGDLHSADSSWFSAHFLQRVEQVHQLVVWPKSKHFVQWVGFLLNSITGKLLSFSTILCGRCVVNLKIQEAVLYSVLILDLKDSITPCSRRRVDITSSVSEIGPMDNTLNFSFGFCFYNLDHMVSDNVVV